jgi:hypothetical protein
LTFRLDSNFKVKVADFGLSRDVYETLYYSTQSRGTKLPVIWMAVESLAGGVFNEKTDVVRTKDTVHFWSNNIPK